jgi:hypothetical protein
VVTRPNPLKRTKLMDKITRKTSFGQWFSPINLQLFEEQVKTMKLDSMGEVSQNKGWCKAAFAPCVYGKGDILS